ncbi:MAG: hypothetical protein IPL83_04000 [Bdellovibrionales bacterium]|nr:hypothetical protein [Bdellovibrionales bacterium]
MNKNQDAYYYEPALKIAPDMPPKLQTPCKQINNLNLKRVIAKSLDPHSGYNWELDVSLSVADLYRAFLFLCKTYPDEIIVPTKEVDDFWHLHILDTRHYIEDCQHVFGYYLHHFPFAGLEGTKVSETDDEKFIENTIGLMGKHFPELL